MKLKAFWTLILSFLLCVQVLALDNTGNIIDEKKVMRVGISNQNFSSQEHKSIGFISDDIIKIIDMSQSYPLDDVQANKPLYFNMYDGKIEISLPSGKKYENLEGPLLLTSNSPLGIIDLNRKGTPAKYRGMIEIRKTKTGQGFNIINIIDIENYLRGVVPNEMPVTFGLEALKAQSIAARNYAIRAKISDNFDVTDSTASQVYYGVNSYKDITDKAVLETIGIYALYNNDEKPISALYFSTSPGITDDWDDVFAQGNEGLHPYLKARYDDINQKPLKTEKDVEEFYSKKEGGYDTSSPKFRWEFVFTKEELKDVLNKTLVEQSRTGLVAPKFDGTTQIEEIRDIKAIRRTQSGKITELLISTDTGDYRVKKELAIRRVLKKNGAILPSADFFITTESKTSEKKESHKIMGIFDIEEPECPESFKLTGGGFGHGVGMSQFGASALSKQGKKYPEILHHYYTDIKLSTLPKKVSYNDYNYWFRTDFYFDKNIFKKAYLYIQNPSRADEFNFQLNTLEFSDTKHYTFNRLIKIDITQFLKDGMNTINFAPLTYKNKGKDVVYRVEFIENGAD